MKKISLVFVGCSQFAAVILERLSNNKYLEILAVVTAPDKKGRRGLKEIIVDQCKKIAIEKNISILQPEKIDDIYQLLKGLAPDFIVVCSYGQKIPGKILKIPKIACLNAHASLLPKYRGATPIQAAIEHGETETGNSIIMMNEKIDAGDIVLMQRTPIEKNETFSSLSVRLAEISGHLLEDAITGLKEGFLKPIPQPEKGISYCYQFTKESGLINLKKSAADICNMIRAYNPEPGTFVFFEGKRLKILQARLMEGFKKGIPATDQNKLPEKKVQPGEVIKINEHIAIATGKNFLIPEKLQLEGKKEMDVPTFAHGQRNFVGSILRGR